MKNTLISSFRLYLFVIVLFNNVFSLDGHYWKYNNIVITNTTACIVRPPRPRSITIDIEEKTDTHLVKIPMCNERNRRNVAYRKKIIIYLVRNFISYVLITFVGWENIQIENIF